MYSNLMIPNYLIEGFKTCAQIQSKVVGSTDFMTKPVVPNKVMEMRQKELTNSQKYVPVTSKSNLKLSYA
jgi:hypothetical protein